MEHSGNFLSFPAKPGLPIAPQHSTSEARAPHSPPAQYQRSQGSPQPPSTVPAKPGLPTAPQQSTSEARAPHSPPVQYQQSQGSPQPQHSTSEARAPHSPSTVPAKPGLPTVPQHSTSKARAPTASQCSTSHQGPSQGLPASLQCAKKLPATRDHHRDCLPLSSARRSSQPPGTITGTACLSPAPEEALQHQKKLPATRDHHRDCLPSVNIHWIFIHSNWKHHD